MSCPRQRLIASLFVGAFLPLLAGAAEPGLTLHVAPGGNDAWSGRLAASNASQTDGPLATPAAARDRIRALKKAGPLPAGGVVVLFAAGRYELAQPLALTAEDSGTADAPIEYRAARGQPAILSGGREVRGWTAVTEPAAAVLDAEARPHVRQADLTAQGITDLGEMKPGATWGQSAPGLELFFDDQPMTLARWPNAGFVTMTEVLGPTPVDIRGTKGCKEGVFRYAGDRPQRWAGQPDVMLSGYWFWDWADQRLKVAAIDPQQRIITLEAQPQHHFGFRKGQWFYAYNLLPELDQPGEWYLDRKQGRLYFWPPADLDRHPTVVTVLPSIVTLKDLAHVTLRGLTLEHCRGDAVSATQADHVRLVACTVRNVGGSGITISGHDSGVLGCDIYQTGNNGISLSGGDRKTLTPARLVVENCHIHHFSRWNPIYKPAVAVSGVGQRVAHNLLHDAPHMAISFSGNDHVIELNEIHSVVYQSNDAGVMYAGYNPTMRGHEIRYNYIHHVYGHESRGCVGVYLDDMFCSARIHGNVFYRVPRAAFIGGGRDCSIDDNIFVDCKPAVHVDARALGWAAPGVELLKKRLAEMPYQQEPWRSRFPQLLKYLDDEPAVPKGNVIQRNIRYGGRWDEIEKKALPHVTLRDNVTEGDPGFARLGPECLDPAQDHASLKATDFELRPDAPAWKQGFEPIPLAKIGLYASEDRATWPVQHQVRPKPAGAAPKAK